MPRLSSKHTPSIHRPELAARLHEAIRRKHVTVREVKVRKPVELHLKAEDECAICLESLTKKNIAVTPCGHKFCFSCISENLNVSKNCPMCRTRIAPDAKKKEITDDAFADIVYQNFEEAADIVSWSEPTYSHVESPDTSDSAPSDWPDTPPHIPNGQLEAFGVGWDDVSANQDEETPEETQSAGSGSTSSGSSTSVSDSDDSSTDSFDEQHTAFIQEFAREHLQGLPPEEILVKINEFSKMLSFAMHVASDMVDFYEK